MSITGPMRSTKLPPYFGTEFPRSLTLLHVFRINTSSIKYTIPSRCLNVMFLCMIFLFSVITCRQRRPRRGPPAAQQKDESQTWFQRVSATSITIRDLFLDNYRHSVSFPNTYHPFTIFGLDCSQLKLDRSIGSDPPPSCNSHMPMPCSRIDGYRNT